MELTKTKYKQTEIGLIPEDWEVKAIISITDNIIDYRGVTPKKKGMEWGNGNIVALSAGNVRNGYIDFDAECYYGSEELYEKWMTNGDCKKNDIVFTMEAPLGNVALIPDDKKYILSQRTILLQLNRTLYCPKFIFQQLMSTQFKNYIINRSTGSTAKGIKRKTFEKLHLILPSFNEQKAIAEVLSDVDFLIQAIEQKLAKKRAIKQGAMQKLLTPPSRTSGQGKEDWEVKKLGEIADINMGQSPKSTFYNKKGVGLPLIQGNADIKNRKTIIRNYTSQITKKCKKGSIIMSVRAPVGEIAITNFVACIGRGVCSINYPNKYLYHYLIYLEPSWSTLSTGSTFDSVNGETIRALEIAIPQEKEQIRIATILSDMDKEIELIEQQLAKYQVLKQGLMQELLTGRIRLTV